MGHATHLTLVDTDPRARALYAESLRAWADARTASGVGKATIRLDLANIAHFFQFVGERVPWECSRIDVDRYGAMLARRYRVGTIRSKQGALRAYMAFLTDPAYDWADRCESLFGVRPHQLCVPENMIPHASQCEDPSRRALTTDEVTRLFAALHDDLARTKRSHRKGYERAARDFVMFSLCLAFGLRAREVAYLERTDFSRAADPLLYEAYGDFGVCTVRWGKALKRGGPRRRQVLVVPYFESVVPILRWYVEEIWPSVQAEPPLEGRLFVTERGSAMTAAYVSTRFALARALVNLPMQTCLHSLRHTYITQLSEQDYAQTFIRQQVGHADASITARYTWVSDDFLRRIVVDKFAPITSP